MLSKPLTTHSNFKNNIKHIIQPTIKIAAFEKHLNNKKTKSHSNHSNVMLIETPRVRARIFFHLA